jgi:hypothetical protein
VNLSNLFNLRVFSLHSIINCKAPRKSPRSARPFAVLHDINTALGTIPESNKVTNLWFDFKIIDRRPFRSCLDQDWAGLFNEIIRIANGKPLELELQMVVSMGSLETEHPGLDELELSMHIMEKGGSLSDYPNICTHFWDPNFWARGLRPFPRGQVRSRCRR